MSADPSEGRERARFAIIKQSELSYVVEFDGDVVDEYTDEGCAIELVEYWSGKLQAAYDSGRRSLEQERPQWKGNEIPPEPRQECSNCNGWGLVPAPPVHKGDS